MEIVKASVYWPGPDLDVLRLYVEPRRMPWVIGSHDEDPDDGEIVVMREVVDDGEDYWDEQETGRISGIELVGFLTFQRWEESPDLPILWQVRDDEPARLDVVLRRLQSYLRKEVAAPAR